MAGTNLAPTLATNDEVLDLLHTTTYNYPLKGQYEALQNLHGFPVTSMMWRKEFMGVQSGSRIEMKVRMDSNGSFTWVNPGASASPGIVNTMKSVYTDWKTWRADWSIIDQEVLRNRNAEAIVNLAETRRSAAMEDIAENLETWAWSSPNAADDTAGNPIFYYLVIPTSAQQTQIDAGYDAAWDTYAGHVGQNPSGYSYCAGIDASDSDNARWQSYVDVWSNTSGDITEEDVRRIARMKRNLRFRSINFVQDMNGNEDDRLRFYTTQTILEGLSARARQQNDSLGKSIDMYYDTPVIGNVPVVWAEPLDDQDDITNAFVAINHKYIKAFVNPSLNFRESNPMRDRTQPSVVTYFIDTDGNFMCNNRQRAGGVIGRV